MQRQLFKTKIVHNNKVYLRAADCADALDYESVQAFIQKNNAIVTAIDGINDLVMEEDYNHLLISDARAFSKQLNIEITKINSLSANTQSSLEMYPLKMAFGGKMFEYKAKEKGCETVEEYLLRYDFPEEEKRILKELKKKKKLSEGYLDDVKKLMDPRVIDPEILRKNGLILQNLTTYESGGKLSLHSYIVGDGIFYQTYIEEGTGRPIYYDLEGNWVEEGSPNIARTDYQRGYEDYTLLTVNEDGELSFPELNEDTYEYEKRLVGRTEEDRDFRNYGVMENLAWVIMHAEIDKDCIDSTVYRGKGLYVNLEDDTAIMLLSHNFTGYKVLIDGILECKEKITITNYKNMPVFS